MSSLHESISYLWGKDVLVNSMNRIHAINKLIASPQAEDKVINAILEGTKEAWEGVKTFFYKVTLTVWVLLRESHRITFNTASAKLLNLINKVSHAAEPVFTNSSDEEEYVEEDGEEDSALEEKKKGLQKEISELEEEIKTKYKNIYFIKSDINKCEEVARVRRENPPLLDEYDQLSLKLFAIEDARQKQKPVKKSKTSPMLSEQEQKEIELRVRLKKVKKKIDKNSLSIHFNDFNGLKDEELKIKTDELRHTAAELEVKVETLKKKEEELAALD